MNRDPIEKILAEEEELVPSSGFLASVMERVRDEATQPPPIPFPWLKAVPGILLAAAVFGWGGYDLIRTALPALSAIRPAPLHISVAFDQPLQDAGWVAGALLISLVSWLLTRRFAEQSGLL